MLNISFMASISFWRQHKVFLQDFSAAQLQTSDEIPCTNTWPNHSHVGLNMAFPILLLEFNLLLLKAILSYDNF